MAMPSDDIDIKPYSDQYRQQVLAVWEASVLSTHHFLTEYDFNEIKALVHSFDFNELQVYCLVKDDLVPGFLGVADKKIEMLFIHPAEFGKGLGKRLMNFAIHDLGAHHLDVNEQNVKAVSFYQKLGFEVFERTDRDEQGRNYPLLRMRLTKG